MTATAGSTSGPTAAPTTRCLWDRALQPKPALAAVLAALRDHERPAAPPRDEPRIPARVGAMNEEDRPAFPEPPAGFAARREGIPHGKTELITYESKTVGTTRKMMVYTPPGYSADRKYPVLYLLHGIGGDETEWDRYASPGIQLDNLIADGKAAPMIVVMPNGRAQKNDRAEGDVFAAAPAFAVFERDLLDDVIPTIEARYRVQADRGHRALAGLSMGGGQALNFGLGHLDTFAWVGGFSSAPNTKPVAALIPDPAAVKQLRLLWLSCGSQDGLLRISRGLHTHLKEHGIPHVWHVPAHGHDPAQWRQDFHNFAQQLFKAEGARNPILPADVPDQAMIRVGDTYYMSSTTMHLSPGLPIMASRDLVNWRLVSYAYETLGDDDALALAGGKSAYGQGSWASSLRHHEGNFYATTFSGTTGKTYVYSTTDLERGPWQVASFRPALHDHSLFFDDDGRVYMVYGGGRIRLVELTADATAIKPGAGERVIIDDASAVAGPNVGLPAEGSQLFKVNGRYYLFNICWPKGGMRTVLIHRADRIEGPYEGRVALRDQGVAQGGLIDTPAGDWFAYLFQDHGAVGRIPYLVPVRWEDGWPVLGEGGRVPAALDLPASTGPMPGLVASDEFDRAPGARLLPLVWQWNHNPDRRFWSLDQRPGFLRLTTGRVDTDLLSARNTLTQRTFGPTCSGAVALDVANLKDGDIAGLALLQKQYGFIGVRVEGAARSIVVEQAGAGPAQVAVPLAGPTVFLRADCDFRNRADTARFFYSLDGTQWTALGPPLKMVYTLPHFMGYRFGLFTFATRAPGGWADFDFFRVTQPGRAETS
jgi:beta-xylosidase/enterochelin esterase-like enzyme